METLRRLTSVAFVCLHIRYTRPTATDSSHRDIVAPWSTPGFRPRYQASHGFVETLSLEHRLQLGVANVIPQPVATQQKTARRRERGPRRFKRRRLLPAIPTRSCCSPGRRCRYSTRFQTWMTRVVHDRARREYAHPGPAFRLELMEAEIQGSSVRATRNPRPSASRCPEALPPRVDERNPPGPFSQEPPRLTLCEQSPLSRALLSEGAPA